jgi:hypothetical protein
MKERMARLLAANPPDNAPDILPYSVVKARARERRDAERWAGRGGS